jgi:preprotein translocase subunit SecE
VQATTAVVIITVFLFAGYFFVVDLVLGNGLDRLMHWLAHR